MCDILMVCMGNTAGTVLGHAEAINKYTDYRASVVQVNPHQFDYKTGNILTEPETQEWLDSIIEDVQVFHWNATEPQRYMGVYNFAPHYIGKINVMHHRGTVCRGIERHGKHWYNHVFVSTPDLTRYHHDYEFLPNPSMTEVEDVTPSWPDEPVYYHNPSGRKTIGEYRKEIKHPEYYPNLPDNETIKGSKRIMEILKCELKPHRTWKEEIEFKAGISMFIDQLYVDAYGVASVEAMQLSKPCMNYISYHSIKVMNEWLDIECPIIRTNWWNFEADFENAKHLDLKDMGKQSKTFVDAFHSPKLIAKRYIEKVIGK